MDDFLLHNQFVFHLYYTPYYNLYYNLRFNLYRVRHRADFVRPVDRDPSRHRHDGAFDRIYVCGIEKGAIVRPYLLSRLANLQHLLSLDRRDPVRGVQPRLHLYRYASPR